MNQEEIQKLDTESIWTDNKGDRYFPSPSLTQAVRVAASLGRPLLIMGEPGCGKTRFAGAVANLLDWDFKEWYVKSTQTAQEALYNYDLVGRLRDSQLLANNAVRDEATREHLLAKSPADYVHQGELGDALTARENTVLLIDEIDKADRDFPNDLLLELDKRQFYVEELKKWRGHPEKDDEKDFDRTSDEELLVIITSNNERELPEPFLRRCIFYYIEFPGTEMLERIIRSHLEQQQADAIAAKVVERFEELRSKMVADRQNGDQVKPPSTSELIDWVKVLRDHPDDEVLHQLQENRMPYAEVLVKRWDDYLKYIKRHQ